MVVGCAVLVENGSENAPYRRRAHRWSASAQGSKADNHQTAASILSTCFLALENPCFDEAGFFHDCHRRRHGTAFCDDDKQQERREASRCVGVLPALLPGLDALLTCTLYSQCKPSSPLGSLLRFRGGPSLERSGHLPLQYPPLVCLPLRLLYLAGALTGELLGISNQPYCCTVHTQYCTGNRVNHVGSGRRADGRGLAGT